MHTLDPTETGARLSIHRSSPSQQKSPTVKYQGNFTRTPGLMYTPFPIEAPNNRRIVHFTREIGMQYERTSGRPKKYQSACTSSERPLSYSLLSGRERSTILWEGAFIVLRRAQQAPGEAYAGGQGLPEAVGSR